MHAKFWHTMCFMFTPMLTVFTGGCTEERDLILQPEVNSEQIVDDEEDLGNEYNGWTYDEVIAIVEQLKVDNFAAVDYLSLEERQMLIEAIEHFDIPRGPEESSDASGQSPPPPSFLPDCHYKDGRQIGFGEVPYSSSTNYSNIWSPNCYFYRKPTQCGSDDWVVSFWMNRSYRGQQSMLKSYSSHWWPRAYLWAWEGRFSVEVYKNDSNGQHSVYACWPKWLESYMAHMQLKQMR